jgi:hypothetical protein
LFTSIAKNPLIAIIDDIRWFATVEITIMDRSNGAEKESLIDQERIGDVHLF